MINKDVLLLIMLKLDNQTLEHFCQVDKNISDFCNGNLLWLKKIENEFGGYEKYNFENLPPRDYYWHTEERAIENEKLEEKTKYIFKNVTYFSMEDFRYYLSQGMDFYVSLSKTRDCETIIDIYNIEFKEYDIVHFSMYINNICYEDTEPFSFGDMDIHFVAYDMERNNLIYNDGDAPVKFYKLFEGRNFNIGKRVEN